MPTVNVKGRRYEAPASLTLREAHEVKQISGLDVLELQAALAKGNAAAMVATVFVAMRRSDPTVTVEQVWELDIGEIEFETGEQDEGADAVPPARGVAAGLALAATDSDSETTPVERGTQSSAASTG